MDETALFPEFESRFHGVLLERLGKGHQPDIPYSQKKLCFVSTDQNYLSELLLELSYREDCYVVRFTVKPKDGMYIGRCFLLDDDAAASLWQQYRNHPRLMCTIQDDDFTADYREMIRRT